jgi:hypothetical protein
MEEGQQQPTNQPTYLAEYVKREKATFSLLPSSTACFCFFALLLFLVRINNSNNTHCTVEFEYKTEEGLFYNTASKED